MHIHVIPDNDLQIQTWSIGDDPINTVGYAEDFHKAHQLVCQQFINTPPLMLIPIDEHPSKGLIRRNIYFLDPILTSAPDTIRVNSLFWGCFESIIDENERSFVGTLKALHDNLYGDPELTKSFFTKMQKGGLHVIGVLNY